MKTLLAYTIPIFIFMIMGFTDLQAQQEIKSQAKTAIPQSRSNNAVNDQEIQNFSGTKKLEPGVATQRKSFSKEKYACPVQNTTAQRKATGQNIVLTSNHRNTATDLSTSPSTKSVLLNNQHIPTIEELNQKINKVKFMIEEMEKSDLEEKEMNLAKLNRTLENLQAKHKELFPGEKNK